MKRLYSFAIAVPCALLALVSCSVKEDVADVDNTLVQLPMVITIDPGNDPDTKHTYDFAGGRMRMHWEDGDAVYCSPAYRSGLGCAYRVPAGGAATNTFVADRQITSATTDHAYYYPAAKVYNDPSFMRFSYAGQVQKKSDPMAHMAEFHSMRKALKFSTYSSNYDMKNVTFAGCLQSGCMVFNLSGVTFRNPKKIMLQVMNGSSVLTNVLYEQNLLSSAYNDSDSGESLVWPSNVASLSLGLEGYGSETSITAYMMHTCTDMALPAGCKLRVTVIGDKSYYADTVIPAATAIKGGYCSGLSVDSGWHELAGDYTEYSWDGDVVTLQNPGTNLDLVIMGDGFIKEDFDNGTYDQIMRQVYSEFFSVEPYATLKNDFNVFYVKTPSPQRTEATNTGANGATNSGNVTKFSVQFTANSTSLSGDNALAREYAKRAFSTNANERIKDATIVVVANQACRAGTCHNSWGSANGKDYGQACAVAYMALGRTQAERVQLIHHEVNGHGFGKLGDEYGASRTGSFSFSTSYWINLQNQHVLGLFRNIDKYITSNFNNMLPSLAGALTINSDVLWYDMIGTANHYESTSVESLGFYEGANTYPIGFCRPTQTASKSIMNANTGIFNAISRRQILYRYRRLKGEVTSNIFGTSQELNYFLQWDAANFLPKMSSMSTMSTVPPMLNADNYEPEALLPFAEPVNEEGVWVDGVFYKNQ